MRIIESLNDARSTLLLRRNFEQVQLSDQVALRIKDVFGKSLSAEQVVDRIIAEVRDEGDAALMRLTAKLDGAGVESPFDARKEIEVSEDEIRVAYDSVPTDVVASIRMAANRIESFHRRQPQMSWFQHHGRSATGQLVIPLQRVAVYAPGGRAAYPSTVLMTAVPARVAGVDEVMLASPAGRDGKVSPLVLVAADVANVDRVFAIGGAQAIAAFAYGTASVPKVDKILGPGNIFVTLAKKKVFGQVAIDQLAGPTETVVIADGTANAANVALDLIAQAEHDPLATAILLTDSPTLAKEVARLVDELLTELSRADIVKESLVANGAIVVVADVPEAIDVANEFAPEHLCLMVKDPWSWLGKIRNAGGVFLGDWSPEAMGDYIAGPSHVMPTGGTARFASPINVMDFVKITSLIALAEEELRELGPAAATIAEAEGFTGHAMAIRSRLSHQGEVASREL